MKRDARQTWRTVGAALPAVALIGSGAALATTGGGATTAIAAESKPVVTVPAAPLTRPAAPVLPALPPIPEAEAQSLPAAYSAGAVPAATANGIPSPGPGGLQAGRRPRRRRRPGLRDRLGAGRRHRQGRERPRTVCRQRP